MASCQAKPTKKRKVKKKKQKNSKTSLWLLFKPKRVGRGRVREKKEIIVLINSYPTYNRKLKKK